MAKQTTIDKSGLSPEVLAYVEGLESENTELAETLTKATDALESQEAIDDEDNTNEDDVLKSADPKVVALIKSAQDAATAATQRAEAAEKIAKAERDVRLTAEMVSKASGLDAIGADAAKLGLALRDVIEKAGQETHDVLWSALTSANEIAKSGALIEKGSSLSSMKSDDSAGEIQKRATALISKGEAKDFNEAVAMVVAADPHLYTEHRSNVNKGA